jgi:hypothetical protein
VHFLIHPYHKHRAIYWFATETEWNEWQRSWLFQLHFLEWRKWKAALTKCHETAHFENILQHKEEKRPKQKFTLPRSSGFRECFREGRNSSCALALHSVPVEYFPLDVRLIPSDQGKVRIAPTSRISLPLRYSLRPHESSYFYFVLELVQCPRRIVTTFR